MKKMQWQLATLTCPTCVKKIEKTLKNTAGVANVQVLFNSSKVKADVDETVVTAARISDIITDLGFDVLSVQ